MKQNLTIEEETIYNNRKEFFKNPKLYFLFFEVTNRCNAHCDHCGSSCGDIFTKDEISGEEIKNVLKEIASNPKYNPKDILLCITGGEPLLRADLCDIMKYACELGFRWGMTSNGMLIDEKMVKKLEDANLYSVSISVDGLEKTHEEFRHIKGYYKRILNGIMLLNKSKKIDIVQVATCVSKKNINELPALYKLFVKMGIKNWKIIPVDPIGRAKSNENLILDAKGYKQLFNFMESIRNNPYGMEVVYGCAHYLGERYEKTLRYMPFTCIAGTGIASIASNGDIIACLDIERRPELVQGNIRKDKFLDIWENEFKIFRKLTRTTNAKCKKCPKYKVCAGDAFHTWDFDNNKPSFCYKELFPNEFKKAKNIFENSLNDFDEIAEIDGK